MLVIPRKPTNNLSTFHRTLASKRCRISSKAAATSFKPCFSHRIDVPCEEERYLRRASELKVQVKMLMEEAIRSLETVEPLELIDNLQRLGISHHFEDQIKNILNAIYNNKYYGKNYGTLKERNLYSTALEFRLLRQHGFRVSQEVFDCFKNEDDEFKASLGEDTKGLLQLYESSFLLTEEENTLDQARQFATIFLKKNLDQNFIIDENLSLLVRHALELPLHWSVPITNARWFIEAYERRSDMNPIMLELAKLDFNIVQAMHQEELKKVSRWWKRTGLSVKLPFVKDRVVETYVWSLGFIQPREYGYQRIMTAKIIGLMSTLDDIFDIYGTLEELQLFVDALQRWDIELIDQLPEYMQICYLAVYNFINEVAYDVLKEKGCIIIPYLRKSWIDYTRSIMQEAKWYHNGHTPSMDEYLNNASISSAGPAVLTQLFFVLRNPTQKEAADDLYKYHNIVLWPSMLTRLVDDIKTCSEEMQRGDVPKTIQCYKNETGANDKEAQEYSMFLIRETWKKLNGEPTVDSPFSQDFIRCSINMGRMSHYVYLHGDGLGVLHPGIKDRTIDLLFKPIE
ncbi:hypothetical protein BUALT_Bualt13G0036400 [Buddleja alternifolia]|uniref:Uncharacterized protein n=1 Tax=Buddleja alternifolia TaxID=168488 RepID=A0AAV6WJN2_9LAMI|nr:hypothetical protein BUALT_Bualt13G0036400 [Buddleja alternifolia]